MQRLSVFTNMRYSLVRFSETSPASVEYYFENYPYDTASRTTSINFANSKFFCLAFVLHIASNCEFDDYCECFFKK